MNIIDINLFLAQFWGWFLLAMGLLFLFKKPAALVNFFRAAEDRAFIASTGFLFFVIGLVTVLLHNVWVWDWAVVVTIFGWLSLTKGVLRIAFPSLSRRLAASFEKKHGLVRVLLLVMIVLGAWLLWASSKVAGL